MNCEEVKCALDAYIDGELDCENVRKLEAHASACEMCGRELEAAKALKDALLHMDDDIVVPLKAQAAWREAIREEALKHRRKHNWQRGVCAVAAAFVLVFGVQFVSNEMKDRQSTVLLQQDATVSRALVARDGNADNIGEDAEGYTVWKKINVSSMDEALQSIQMLADEYSAGYAMEEEGVCRIDIPYGYLDDFLKAASSIGVETYSETVEHKTETAVVLFQIYENENNE